MKANPLELSTAVEGDHPPTNVFLIAWHHSFDWLTSIPSRIRTVIRRYQAYRIRKAIESYSFEKHVLGKYYKPVVSPTTMRLCLGQVEKNKLPFHVHRRCTTPQFTTPLSYRGIKPIAELDNGSRLEFYLPISSDYAEERKPRS